MSKYKSIYGDVGRRIKERRIRLNMSREELVERVTLPCIEDGMRESDLPASDWILRAERGYPVFNLTELQQIAEALDSHLVLYFLPRRH